MRTKSQGNGNQADWKRLAGGPKVPPHVYEWWNKQAKLVADKEHLRKPSIPLLMTRIVDLDPDLTQEAVNRATKKRTAH